MCLYPQIIRNPKYRANKKNGGEVPVPNDKRVLYVPIGCQKCIECRKQKSNNWKVRLTEEIRDNNNAKFVTMTFSGEELKYLNSVIDENITGYERDNEIATIAVRRFLERWRKKYKKSVRHWLVTELGGGHYEHLHIHGIIFTDNVEAIKERWGYGFVYIGDYVNEDTISYIVKYITKTDEKHENYNPKILTSSGIGSNYMNRIDAKNNKYKEGKTNETYRNGKGYKLALPIYYRNKIYTEEEREKLWLEKLDKQKRYVLGAEIDISKTDEGYFEAIKWARKKNKRLGYGNDNEHWSRKKYENQQADINRNKKIEDAHARIIREEARTREDKKKQFIFDELQRRIGEK